MCTFHEKCKLLSFQSNILNKHCVIYLSSLHCHKLSILFQAQYFLFVSSQHILNKDDFLWVMNSKEDIFLLLNLRTSEGLMFFITKLGLSPPRGNSAQARLSEVSADRDRPKSRYVQLGLSIYQIGVQPPSPLQLTAHSTE